MAKPDNDRETDGKKQAGPKAVKDFAVYGTAAPDEADQQGADPLDHYQMLRSFANFDRGCRNMLKEAMATKWPYCGGEYPADKLLQVKEGITFPELDKALAGWKRGDPIAYMKAEAPDFSLADYAGEEYEIMVPATLDIQERAELGMNALIEQTDPDTDYEIWDTYWLAANPPLGTKMTTCMLPKYMEAMFGCRLISGSKRGMEVEQAWLESILKMQGEDGLFYWGMSGRPWFPILDTMVSDFPDLDFVCCPFDLGRFANNCSAYYKMTGDDVWRETGEKLILGMQNAVLEVDDYAFFPKFYYGYGEKSTPDMSDGSRVAHMNGSGFVLDGVGKFFRATGFEPAGEFGRKIAGHLMRIMPGFENVHFHTNTQGTIGLLDIGIGLGDSRILDFAHEHFERLKVWGDTELGFFPEAVGPQPFWRGAETCEVAGMIISALKLMESGRGDYWDDVENWIRNQFAENQFTHADFIPYLNYQMLDSYAPASGFLPTYFDERWMTRQGIEKKLRGAFAGFAAPNDLVGRMRFQVGCCTGNGNRTWYHIWENILHEEEGRVKINLLLNRGAASVDVHSHLPYCGRIDVHAKQAVKELQIRIPGWTKESDLRLQVDGADRQFSLAGRYLQAGGLNPGQQASLTFPIEEKPDIRWIQNDRYNIRKRGYEVVEMDPSGETWPLYQRRHYRSETTLWKKIKRFVPSKPVYF